MSDTTLSNFWLPLIVTRVTRVSDPAAELPLPDDQFSLSPSPRFLMGGSRTRLEFDQTAADWTDSVAEIDRLSLTLRPDGAAPIDLPVRIVTDGPSPEVVVAVPNISRHGALDIAIEWHDTCFRFESTMTIWLFIDRVSSVDGCATRRNPAFDELFALFDPPIHVGPLDVELRPFHFYGKVESLGFSGDVLPPYSAFGVDTATFAADPGTTVRIRDDRDRTLSIRPDSEVIFFRRGELIRWLQGGWIHGDAPEAEVVFRSALVATDGGFAFTLPTEPGRYAAQPLFDYNAVCSYGIAGPVVGIDVE